MGSQRRAKLSHPRPPVALPDEPREWREQVLYRTRSCAHKNISRKMMWISRLIGLPAPKRLSVRSLREFEISRSARDMV